RDDMPFDGHAVAVPGGGPDPRWSHGSQPLIEQKSAKPARRRPDKCAFAKPGKCLVQGLLALPLGPEASLAALAALAGHRGGAEEGPRPSGPLRSAGVPH